MERMLQKMIQAGATNLGDLIQRVGPQVAMHWGPTVARMTNEVIRQYIPGWPF